MKSLIVYDSVFGNTERIAKAMGNALGSKEDTQIIKVADIKPEHFAGLTLLIVGSPTRQFRATEGIVRLLKEIPGDALKSVQVAAFDTRIDLNDIGSGVLRAMVKLGGYAAPSIAKKLTSKGGNLISAPEGFFVNGEQGPLKEGELERAASWARRLIQK